MIKRIAILISGRGSNMAALIDGVRSGAIVNAEVAVVISDQPTAAGLERAAQFGIETMIIERQGRSRAEHDREIVAALKVRNIDLVCLAGYMRVLSADFINAYRGRILNIHPSLLPSFPGLNAQQQALDHRATISGCTVHFVDETLDGGAIIAQREVPVSADDTAESLAARILIEEHQLYPEAVNIALRQLAEASTCQQ
ncbi:MAG TPA: phosphoribosylglycinamide formyltransferase [Pyrinomonadaceae bacterium]|jgi:phosphoribosylglycinamide formyltransferase-1|nr:phosphoribosylglycinamide formyltransferase [Pyrinomonadaceae bacterium]